MKIACVTSDRRGEIDRLLTGIAEDLAASGTSLAGLVKEHSYESQFDNGCDMKVRVLPEGPVIKITQSLGKGSGSCRLDPAAIAEAVGCVERSNLAEADLFILNKFGPEEAAGRGFCAVIGQALEQDIPVLVGVGPLNMDAFERFVGDMADRLPADSAAIHGWFNPTGLHSMSTAPMSEHAQA